MTDYNIGDSPSLTVTFVNKDGNLADPVGVAFRYKAPDGAVIEFEWTAANPGLDIVRLSLGVFTASVPLLQSGYYAWQWIGQGNNVDAVEESTASTALHVGTTGFSQEFPDFLFHPNQVPQIAAGEAFIPGVNVLGGASSMSWRSLNGTNTVTAAVANCPDMTAGPGGNRDWSFVKANIDTFSSASPQAPIAGADALWIGQWFRFDNLDNTAQTLIERYDGPGERSFKVRKSASSNVLEVRWSDNGTNELVSNKDITELEGLGTISQLDKYLFGEWMIDPQGSTLAEKTRMWLNRQEIVWGSQTGTGGASLANTGIFRIGGSVSATSLMQGRIGPTYLGRRVGGVLLPSSDDIQKVMDYGSPKQRRLNLVLDGNSIMFGQNASSAANTPPALLRAALVSLGYPSRDIHDRGTGGIRLTDPGGMIDRFPTTGPGPFYDPCYDKNVLIFFEVRNDFIAGKTAEQIIAAHQQYCALAHSTGFHVIVCTAPPSGGTPFGVGIPGTVNAWIRDNHESIAEGFCDLEARSEFRNPGSGSGVNGAVYSDDVHGTDIMYQIMAVHEFLPAVISALGVI